MVRVGKAAATQQIEGGMLSPSLIDNSVHQLVPGGGRDWPMVMDEEAVVARGWCLPQNPKVRTTADDKSSLNRLLIFQSSPERQERISGPRLYLPVTSSPGLLVKAKQRLKIRVTVTHRAAASGPIGPVLHNGVPMGDAPDGSQPMGIPHSRTYPIIPEAYVEETEDAESIHSSPVTNDENERPNNGNPDTTPIPARPGLRKSRTLGFLSNLSHSISRMSLDSSRNGSQIPSLSSTSNITESTQSSIPRFVRKNTESTVTLNQADEEADLEEPPRPIGTPPPLAVLLAEEPQYVTTAMPFEYWSGRFTSASDKYLNDLLQGLMLRTACSFNPSTSVYGATRPPHPSVEYLRADRGSVPLFHLPLSNTSNTLQTPFSKITYAGDASHGVSAGPRHHDYGCRVSEATLMNMMTDDEKRARRVFRHLASVSTTEEARRSLWAFQQAYARKAHKAALLPPGGTMEDPKRRSRLSGRFFDRVRLPAGRRRGEVGAGGSGGAAGVGLDGIVKAEAEVASDAAAEAAAEGEGEGTGGQEGTARAVGVALTTDEVVDPAALARSRLMAQKEKEILAALAAERERREAYRRSRFW
ncbi:hypothetical protein B0H66DRAFT_592684 [Apodospora peruviana]|uniref:Uncharacterized protein n=1 Tax=Apodospora peruviana TaxID=516989 RepID=A0AAE0M243_9PEZI|nr:hypothetical protein B0H66DRAFT_592684 [Apodospora peruviana]